eukprot:c23256_g1_i1 orf=166-3090(+)
MERRWKEAGLVAFGIVLHALYMLSIFDIYFKTPIVHGMEPVPPRMKAPAKRLVLFVADGLRADKFFEMDSLGKFKAPFLREVIINKGRWGVSHARPPTESRPGHVAIIAGFYEDPSAVTKGWKANPVEFDSLFNRSRYTVSFGSPDIVPMFCGSLSHCYWQSYPHEYEDFSRDASFLDEWSFDQFQLFLNHSKADPELQKKLGEDGLVIFLHLLGCDTNGHAHRPHSSIYLNNIGVVDRGVQETYQLMEDYFPDGRTAYVFTADHGMSDKGSHGDGDPANTETPLVAWGAGVHKPSAVTPEDDPDDGERFVDDHAHHLLTPLSWGLSDIERVDINQGDIASLMSILLGLPCPMNSVGKVPIDYLDIDQRDQAEAVFANAKQILNQFLRKSQLKQETSLRFKPFKPLASYPSILRQINMLINWRQYVSALQLAKELIDLSLAGLHYFQTYDWFALMTTVALGYLGWMIYVLLYVIRRYTSFFPTQHKRFHFNAVSKSYGRSAGGFIMGFCSIVLLIEHAPLLYFFYIALALSVWTEILSDITSLRVLWNAVGLAKLSSIIKIFCGAGIACLILELLVMSFFRREVYTGIFFVAGVVGAVIISCNIPGLSIMPAVVWAACWFLSGFTLMPAQIPDNTSLVVVSGILVVMVAFGGWCFDCTLATEQAWRSIVCGPARKSDTSWQLFSIQVLLVMVSTLMVWISTADRAKKRGLPLIIQLINWSIAGLAVVLPLFSPRGMMARLSSVFLGFAPPFLLLSIGYEALFYNALALVLFSWILVESAMLHSPAQKNFVDVSGYSLLSVTEVSSNPLSLFTREPWSKQNRLLQLPDIRVALCFLVFINVAFFGTGNVASVASFEISSVYRFITIFSPFIMAALLLFKLAIPFILVTCAFSAIIKLLELPRPGCYFMVLFFSDIMTIHFFFLVQNTGSWLEIGQTISHFGIMSAQVVFVLLLFSITNAFTKNITITQQGLAKSI